MGKYLCLLLFFSAYVTTSRACSSRPSLPTDSDYDYNEFDANSGTDTAAPSVFGGIEVAPGDYPHQISLQNTDRQNRHFCGASIIHPKFLLSAAHCFGGTRRVPYIRAVAGEHDLFTSDGNREQIRTVARVIPHENYNAETSDNDIALLELDKPLNFDDKYVRSVGLWDSTWSLPQWVRVSGWGVTESGSASRSLMAAQIRIRDQGVCRQKYGTHRIITSNMICAGGYRDACRGDSGGSLTCSRSNRQYLCGIVSFGFSCQNRSSTDLPGVYTDVTKYKEWIQRNAAIRI